jgi:predicted phosphodiesterase
MSNKLHERGASITNTKARTIIIGDLHGCATEARELIKRCNAGKDDIVVFLGDLIDRGHENDACVELAIDIEQRQGHVSCVLGNHEERHLRYHEIERSTGRVDVRIPSHVATRMQLTHSHLNWMSQLPRYVTIPQHNVACVHAGVWPDRKLSDQFDQHFLHGQMIRPGFSQGNQGHPEKTCWPTKVPHNESGWVFWSQAWKGPERIVFGHTVLTEPLITDKVVGLDGGGCYGRELWALVLPDNVIVRQPCSRYRHPQNVMNRQPYMLDVNVGIV